MKKIAIVPTMGTTVEEVALVRLPMCVKAYAEGNGVAINVPEGTAEAMAKILISLDMRDLACTWSKKANKVVLITGSPLCVKLVESCNSQELLFTRVQEGINGFKAGILA